MPFAEVLSQVQSYLSGTYATLITENGNEAKEQMKRRIARICRTIAWRWTA